MIQLLLAASIAIIAPADQASLEPGDIHITLAAQGEAEGSHAHVVLDRGPALEAKLDEPLVLHQVKPGAHSIRAVLVNRDHLSYKTAAALALARISVGPTDQQSDWPEPKKPILTLVLPTGGAGDAPVLDVHVRGATLSRRGYKVRVVIDKREMPLMTAERPRKLKLKKGKHSITVDLLDERGTKVTNAVNRTDRKFEIK